MGRTNKNFDRASEKRTDKSYLVEAIQKPNTKYVIYKNCWPLVETAKDCASLAVLNFENVKDLLEKILNGDMSNLAGNWPDGMIFVGIEMSLIDKENWFALNIDDNLEMLLKDSLKGRHFVKQRMELISLLTEEASLVCQTKAMFHWLDRYRFCATCGAKMFTEEAGYKRTCKEKNCRSNRGVHNTCYPRTDPSVIMCVVTPDKKHCLLGRKSVFPTKMYSCLAGFVEPGESIEDAVIRETKEESGINVESVSYVSSQSWPFPSSLMIGCVAIATNTDIKICEEEMEDVKWFSFEQIKLALNKESPDLILPPSQAIAHYLIKHCVSSIEPMLGKSSL